jgi:hypothetical protein
MQIYTIIRNRKCYGDMVIRGDCSVGHGRARPERAARSCFITLSRGFKSASH